MSTVISNSIAIECIHGVWYLSRTRSPDGSLLLTRDSGNSMGWGERFEFNANGAFVDASSARCGNDLGIHHWSGIWTWNDETGLLSLQIKGVEKESYTPPQPRMKASEDYLRGREFHVIEASDEKLVLMPITKETRE